jgi:hypothetical protein
MVAAVETKAHWKSQCAYSELQWEKEQGVSKKGRHETGGCTVAGISRCGLAGKDGEAAGAGQEAARV